MKEVENARGAKVVVRGARRRVVLVRKDILDCWMYVVVLWSLELVCEWTWLILETMLLFGFDLLYREQM